MNIIQLITRRIINDNNQPRTKRGKSMPRLVAYNKNHKRLPGRPVGTKIKHNPMAVKAWKHYRELIVMSVVAKKCEVTPQSIQKLKVCPLKYAIVIQDIYGIPVEKLRPDLHVIGEDSKKGKPKKGKKKKKKKDKKK